MRGHENAADTGRDRRPPGRQRPPLAPVEPAVARRRVLVGAATAVLLTALVVAGIGLLIRAHAMSDGDLAVVTLLCLLLTMLAAALWYGTAGRAGLTVADGRPVLSARTITGIRTIRLDELSHLRRYELLARDGRPIDELRLRDRHGVRLGVQRVPGLEDALRRAVRDAEGAAPKVTRHARGRLGLEPRSAVPDGAHQVFGIGAVVALMLPSVVCTVLAYLLAGL